MASEIDFLFARIDKSKIYPPFLERCQQLLGNLADQDVFFYATNGLRTVEEQDALFMKGRRGVPGEGRVTNARGGYSAHNYGVAIDFCRDGDIKKAGLQPVWKTSEYQILADEAQALNLEAGYYWKSIVDGPHIQLPLMSHKISTASLLPVYQKGGLPAVWKHLDKFAW